MGPPDRKSQTFYRITRVPPPAAHAGALRALAGLLERLASRLAGKPRRATPKRRRA